MPLACKPRQHVFQLRQLHLKTPFGGARAAREYIEDELGAVDDFDLNGSLEIALLGGRDLMVHNQHVGLVSLGQVFQLRNLAVPEQSGRVEDRPDLKHLGDDRGAGAHGQFGQLAKGFGGSCRRRSAAAFEAREDSLLRVLFQ